MRTSKLFLEIGLIALFFVMIGLVTLESPHKKGHQKMLEKLEEQHGGMTKNEIMELHPELKYVEELMANIKQLEFDIRQATQDPIPPCGDAALSLNQKIEDAHRLKGRLSQLFLDMENKAVLATIER